ncbi:MAG: glycosyl transferase [Hahellaceae bacterium]|nr:glycosyl transferase [Hahellaceae bacterium]
MIHTLGIDPRTLPPVRVLGNGRYTVLLHDQGGGWSRWQGLAINDWSWDGRQEDGGLRIYLQDLESGKIEVFGDASGPGCGVILDHPDGVQLVARRGDWELAMVIAVAADVDCEMRQLRVTNLAGHARRLALTVHLPLALHHPAAHRGHPAFSRLFVQTEFLDQSETLLARRRPRAQGDPTPYAIAGLSGPGTLSWDSGRASFLGRSWGDEAPQGLADGLAKQQGIILDAAFSLQRRTTIEAGGCATWVYLIGAAEGRDAALRLAQTDPAQLRRMAPDTSGVLAEALAGALTYRHRPVADTLPPGHPGTVWAWGLPTDSPYLMVKDAGQAQIEAAVQLQQTWQRLGLSLPIAVILNQGAVPESPLSGLVVQRASALSDTDFAALQAVAALCVSVLPGSPKRLDIAGGCLEPLSEDEILLQDNGIGGFSADGREYVIRLRPEKGHLAVPPLPWVNLLANPKFGAIVSETGSGCTWSVNSHQRRLTHWANDPVRDPAQETFWIEDLVQGEGLSPLPNGSSAAQWMQAVGQTDTGDHSRFTRPPVLHEIRHGFGSTEFHCRGLGLTLQTTVFVHRTLPVKVYRLSLEETRGVSRTLRLSTTQNLVLGFLPEETHPYLKTHVDWSRRCLVARNPMAGPFADRLTFATLVVSQGLDVASWQPTAGRDFEQHIVFHLGAGSRGGISLLFGDVANESELASLLQTLNTDINVQAALTDVQHFWRELFETVQVETPDPAFNWMCNGWLLYQTIACRVWGRTALYQSSGAYGFRDQLQDSGAFLLVRPKWTREQILLHASRQFVEGDVQHWWHEPPLDRGLRTRFADDLNWMPWLTSQYLVSTGDLSLLDEVVPFLQSPRLKTGEDEAYQQADLAAESGSLYEHCCRALDRSLTKGSHGLPLMGTGDWNDGMNRVGREGRGESVWMGFFLYDILTHFLPFCELRGDQLRVDHYRAYRDHLYQVLNDEGWDGDWYRRAWYDNGAVLGSKDSDECQIDALVQAWAVLSGGAPPARVDASLKALEAYLIDREGGLIRLLAPPFADTSNDPGYIKGYVAGVRENGGQYTHAATWVVRAFAEAGRRDTALDLYRMLLPTHHTQTAESVARYQTEPYVVVADVYGVAPHIGRGGWTWYTGSSGWMFRVGVESILGLRCESGRWLWVRPCIPAEWPGFQVRYRTPSGGELSICVYNGGKGAPQRACMNGVGLAIDEAGVKIPLEGLTGSHQAEIWLA